MTRRMRARAGLRHDADHRRIARRPAAAMPPGTDPADHRPGPGGVVLRRRRLGRHRRPARRRGAARAGRSAICTPAPAPSGWRRPAGAPARCCWSRRSRRTAQLIRRNAADLGLEVEVTVGPGRTAGAPAVAHGASTWSSPTRRTNWTAARRWPARSLVDQRLAGRGRPGGARAVPAVPGADLAGRRGRGLGGAPTVRPRSTSASLELRGGSP